MAQNIVSRIILINTDCHCNYPKSISGSSIGFLAGMFFLGIQLLQKYGYVSTVNWDKLGNDTSTHIQHWTTSADMTNLHGLFHTLGIPVSGGLGLGLLAGFVRTR
jgi:uncharacterized membrane protein (Fun14 family)